MSKAPIHYTRNTLESETPTGICGVRTSHAASTENAQAVTCQRCLKALNKNLPFAEAPSDGPQTNDATQGVVVTEDVETVVSQPEAMTPAETQQVLQEPVLFAGATFKIVSDGVQLDEAVELTDATRIAQEMSATLGDDVVVSVMLGAVPKMQYKGGHHLAPVKIPKPKKSVPRESTPEGKAQLDAAIKNTKPKPNGKVTDIGKAKQTKAEKQVALGKATQAPKPAAVPKAARVAKELPLCKCGCGERTKGGVFRPGHDARYYSAQAKAGKGGHTAAKAAKK